ncbi:MAG: PKD domain-containing protein [Spirochaetota bacterium]
MFRNFEKDLSIVSFGIETNSDEGLKPGQKVVFFAKANKIKDVSYQWSFNNEPLDKQGDKIEIEIPHLPGTYLVSVTATNLTNSQKITHSEKLLVQDSSAELIYENFKVKIKTKTKIVEKDFSDEKDVEMQVESNDGVTNITVTSEDDGTHSYCIENGNMYEVDKSKSIFNLSSKKKLLIKGISFDITKVLNKQTESTFNLLCKNFGTPVKLSETSYSFSKNDSISSATIIFDTSINRITEMKVVDFKSKTISAVKYIYEYVNGHINLKSMENAEISIDPLISSASYCEMNFEWL